MAEPLPDRIIQAVHQSAGLYHRLIIVVGPTGAGKTKSLQDIHARTGAPLININLELSGRMLELTERQRALQLSRILSEIVVETAGEIILLDNIEVLFDVALQQRPLRLLQGLSRNKTVVAAWNGLIESNHLVYAAPDHPEHQRHPTRDLLIVNAEFHA